MKTGCVFTNQITSPVGQVLSAGHLEHALGVPGGEHRRYNAYGLVYLISGKGTFSDHTGFKAEIGAGNLVLLFPGIEHEYRPRKGTTWEEIYLLFDGSVFNLWMLNGLMTPSKPVLTLHPVDYWAEELNQLIGWRPLIAQQEALKQICALQHFLAAAFCEQANIYNKGRNKQWIDRACDFLRQGQTPQQTAQKMGLSYETFRKDFSRRTGIAPAKYRAKCQMHRAAEMLLHHDITLTEIADEFGFTDAYHFSNRFKQLTGKSPREFRNQAPQVT